jgi:hypothetical protein
MEAKQMHVNLAVNTVAFSSSRETRFEVSVFVHDEDRMIGHAKLYSRDEWAQRPDETTNLNLWVTAMLRGLVARLEETFVYVDQRPEALLMKNAIERYKSLWCRSRMTNAGPPIIDPAGRAPDRPAGSCLWVHPRFT